MWIKSKSVGTILHLSKFVSALYFHNCRQIGKMLNAREPKIVNGPQILDKYVGESEANIRKLFAEAEEEEKRVKPLSAIERTWQILTVNYIAVSLFSHARNANFLIYTKWARIFIFEICVGSLFHSCIRISAWTKQWFAHHHIWRNRCHLQSKRICGKCDRVTWILSWFILQLQMIFHMKFKCTDIIQVEVHFSHSSCSKVIALNHWWHSIVRNLICTLEKCHVTKI